MGSTSIFSLMLTLRKHLRMILLITGVCAIFGYFLGTGMQNYTASMTLAYENAAASEGLSPNGTALDVYQIMSPAVVEKSLSDLDISVDLTVEDVRNSLSITEIVDTTATELQAASIKLGEEYPINPTKYTISYNYDASFGEEFGIRELFSLINAYDEYYANEYYSRNNISDFMSLIDTGAIDYLDLSDVIKENIQNIINTLTALAESDNGFRSMNTGYTFAALTQCYQELLDVDWEKYYANVRWGLLSKNSEVVIQNYRSRINDLTLSATQKMNDVEMYKTMISTFYDAYKKNNLYYQAAANQGADTVNDNQQTVIYDYNLDTVTNTYDSIILNYTENGASASSYQRQIEFNERLIDEFKNDTVSSNMKQALLEANTQILKDITDRSAQYATIANQTVQDYYDSLTVTNLTYLVTVSAVANISVMLIVLLAAVLGAAFSCVFIIFATESRSWLEANRSIIEKDAIEQDALKSVETLSPLQHAAMEQHDAGFDEFYLVYQPVVDKNDNWIQSEAFVRWNSKTQGEISPAEFLPVMITMGYIDDLNLWAIRKSGGDYRQFIRKTGDDYGISLNCSAQQMGNLDFVKKASKLIKDAGIDAKALTFEVSGGAIENYDVMTRAIYRLKELGCHICIDRFGDSISDLEILDKLPLDQVKISRKLIVSANEETNPLLLQTIVACKKRGIRTCVVGVEEEVQKKTLRILGIQEQQGYYFAKPQQLNEHIESMPDRSVNFRSRNGN